METEPETKDADAAKGGILRAFRSVKARTTFATVAMIVLILAVFYAGGRIMLVRFFKEGDQQVTTTGMDLSRLVMLNANRVRRNNAMRFDTIAAALARGDKPEDILVRPAYANLALVGYGTPEGEFKSAALRIDESVSPLSFHDFDRYAKRMSEWCSLIGRTGDDIHTIGLMNIGGVPIYISARRTDGGSGDMVLLGAAFAPEAFTEQANDGFHGSDVHILSTELVKSGDSEVEGLTQFISKPKGYRGTDIWSLGATPDRAEYAIRDIAGYPVAKVSVSLPKSLSGMSTAILTRLALVVVGLGLLIVIPLFWVQGRVILNPLSRMTREIHRISEAGNAMDCPRLKWDGRDEFAQLADSVNRMLETITERTVAVGHLRDRERALIRAVPDALVVFDESGRLVSVTKEPDDVEELPGLKAGEAPSAEVYGAAGAEAFVAAVRQVFADGHVALVRMEDVRGEDESARRHFEMRLTKIDDFFALATVRDVTDEVAEHKLRIAAETRAQDAFKRESLTLLAAGIAHDVNNVLAIVMNTSNMFDPSDTPEIIAERIHTVREAVKRGSAMMKELMAFAGETRLKLARTSPASIIRDIDSLVRNAVPANVSIGYSFDDDAPDVDVDPNQFWKVIFNIAKNAGEAIGTSPGHIYISTHLLEMTRQEAVPFRFSNRLNAGKGTLFKLTDDGPGIPDDLKIRLFDPYVSSKADGRGLGLATVRSIVEAHGGGIRVESEPGKGTEFLIWLPESTLPETVQDEAATEADGANTPSDVLVVDDEDAILKSTSILLKMLKVTAHLARDRAEALSVLRRKPVGVVLLDVNLGGVDAVMLLGTIRALAPDAKIVLSSGSSEEELRKRFAGHPFDGILAKPYTIDELKAAIS